MPMTFAFATLAQTSNELFVQRSGDDAWYAFCCVENRLRFEQKGNFFSS